MHVCCWLFFVRECTLEVRRGCIARSAPHRSYCTPLFDAPPASATNYFPLKKNTKIIELRPCKSNHGILGRARNAAALARTQKPGQNLKKPMSDLLALSVAEKSRRQFGIPIQNLQICMRRKLLTILTWVFANFDQVFCVQRQRRSTARSA